MGSSQLPKTLPDQVIRELSSYIKGLKVTNQLPNGERRAYINQMVWEEIVPGTICKNPYRNAITLLKV